MGNDDDPDNSKCVMVSDQCICVPPKGTGGYPWICETEGQYCVQGFGSQGACSRGTAAVSKDVEMLGDEKLCPSLCGDGHCVYLALDLNSNEVCVSLSTSEDTAKIATLPRDKASMAVGGEATPPCTQRNEECVCIPPPDTLPWPW